MVKSESGHGFMGTGGVMMVENPDKSPGSSKYITEQAYMEEVKYGKTKLEKEADDKSRKVEGYLILKRLIEEEMQTVFYGAVMLQSRHRQGWYHDEDMALKEMEKIKLRKPVSAYIANYLTMQYGKRYYSKSYYDKECSTFEKEHEQLKEKFGSLSEFQPTSYDELEREIKRTKKIIHKSRRSKDCYKCLKFWYNSFFCCGVGLEMNNGHGYIERGCQPVRCGESWGDTQSWGLSNNKSYFQKEQCQGRMIIGCCCCVLPFCTPDPQWIFGELCWTNERWFGCFRQELAENWCNCCCCCCISNYFNYYTGTGNSGDTHTVICAHNYFVIIYFLVHSVVNVRWYRVVFIFC